jgi:hypothetical protein
MIIKIKYLFLFVLTLFGFLDTFAQTPKTPSTATSEKITISGKAYDGENRNLPLPKLMIINMATNQGIFADAEGKFTLLAKQTDTLVFSALGFMVKKICLKDSVVKSSYAIEVPLFKMQYTLKEVTVFETRSLNQIQRDIERLGVNKTYKTEGAADALSSPITYLYERFSKLEKSKRKVAEWENNDLRREVLKDLFRIYIKNDIIDLSTEEFDAFIVYLNLSDEFIKNASQYELVMAIKGKYESFKYRWK